MTRRCGFTRDESGQTLVIFAALASGLIGMIGLAFDAGLLYASHRAAQDAADAAAIAAAIVIRQEGDASDVVAAARDDAARNGYANVTVEYPPLGGPHALDTLYVRVTIDATARAAILPGSRDFTVSALATIATSDPPPAIWASGGQKKKDIALEAEHGSAISVSGSDIVIASTNRDAAKVDHDSVVSVAPPNEILIAGGVTGTGFQPEPRRLGKTPPDPFAGFPKPTVDGVPVRDCCGSVLQAGVYPDGITKLPQGVVTMRPGIYVLKGKGLDVAEHTTLVGNGVFVYLTDKDYPNAAKADHKRQCGDVTIKGEIHLTAPTSGAYQGMTIYEDPRCKNTDVQIDKATVDVTGSIYLPTAALVVRDTAVSLTSAVVVQSIKVDGNATVSIRLDPVRAAPPRGDARLAG